MEITLEKIELVKDRTGVTYKEAKEALEKANGDTVEAIIYLENEVNGSKKENEEKFSNVVVEKVKELVKKGNVSKISIKKDGEVVVNVPINAGIVGAVIAPWGVVAAAVCAFGFRCSIEILTEEGEVIDVTETVKDKAQAVKEKGGVAFDYAKEKAPEAWQFAREKGEEALNFAKEKAPEVWDFAKEKGEEVWDFAKEKGGDAWDFAKEKLEERKQSGASTDVFNDLDIKDKDINDFFKDEDR